MKKIQVGLPVTLSGKYSTQGKESFNGLGLWVEKVNSYGGILVGKSQKKVPVELIYHDDKSNPENTRKITKKLILEDKVDILLGPYSSTLTVASAETTDLYNRVLWNYGGSSDEVTCGRFKKIVSTITPASGYFEPFLYFIKEREKNIKPVAIAFAKDSGFSTEGAKGAMSICEQLGISYKLFKYKSGKENFIDIARQLRLEGIKYVLGVGRFEDDLNLAKHLKGFCSCLVAAGIEEFKNRMQKKAEGFFSVTQWEPIVEHNIDFGVTSKQFADLYQKKFKKIPDYVSAQSFNMGIILEKFIEETNSTDEQVLMDKITNSNFCTFYGNFEIDQKSGLQVGHKTLLIQWQNGKKEIVCPVGQRTARAVFTINEN